MLLLFAAVAAAVGLYFVGCFCLFVLFRLSFDACSSPFPFVWVYFLFSLFSLVVILQALKAEVNAFATQFYLPGIPKY